MFCWFLQIKLVDSSLEMLQKIRAKIFFLKWFSGPSGRFSLKSIFESTSRWLLIDRNGLPLLTLCIKRFKHKLLFYFYPLHSGHKLAVHKMIRRRPGLLLNFLTMFNFQPITKAYCTHICALRPNNSKLLYSSR